MDLKYECFTLFHHQLHLHCKCLFLLKDKRYEVSLQKHFQLDACIFLHTGSGSSSYVRWGRTTCPSTCDTTLVYAGRVGGTYYNVQGGAADYLCLPDDPEYSDFVPGFGGNQDRQV